MSAYNHNSTLLNLLQTARAKESTYREYINRNQAKCKATAHRFHEDSEDVTLLRKLAVGDDPVLTEEEVENFLQEQRTRLQNIARENVRANRVVDHFLESLSQLQGQLQQQQGQADDETIEDYHQIIQNFMKQHSRNDEIAMDQEELYRQVCSIMGQDLASNADEEIQVMGQPQAASLTCPITTVLLEDPVKSTVCQHTYSRAAITAHIAGHHNQCPVPGCHNDKLTMKELVKDDEMEIMVRREKRRLERQEGQRMTQTVDDEEDDDEF